MTTPAAPPSRILLVDDDPNFRRVAAHHLGELGGEVLTAGTGEEALALLRGERFDLLLSDVKMPGMDGMALLREVRRLDASLPIILVTAHGDIEMAVEAMQLGATDFITKPFDRARLREKAERALRLPRLERENQALREELASRFSFQSIIGSSPAMRGLFELMSRVLHREATVLILGESGTGKELVARALHYAGPRAGGNFVAVNCAAIPATLLESELFGHVKGAFTGAEAAREGRFVLASGGTLFLDEIGDMPLELQAKLLRVLQERVVEPVGSSRPVPVDVRIITATHRNLEAMIAAGEFRQDLFYRLNVVPLPIPPLRDRLEDLPLLVKHFLARLGAPEIALEPEVFDKLRRHDWPGNVRELENTIERALALRERPDRLTPHDIMLPDRSAAAAGGPGRLEIPEEGIVLDDVEKQLIQSALRKTGENQTRAAQLLGITRQKLIYRMHKYGLE